jgi:predicted outer membrane protein
MSARSRFTGFFAAAVLAIATVVVAQQQPGQAGRQIDRAGQPGQPTAGQPGQPVGGQSGQLTAGQSGQPNKTDSELAAWLIIDNQGEIAAAKIAEQRASSNEVKQFAQQMINEHSQFLDKLQRFAGEQGGSLANGQPATSGVQIQGADGSNQAGATAGNQGSATNQIQATTTERGQSGTQNRQQAIAGGSDSHGLDIVDLKRRLGEQCKASLQRELESKSGRDFDKCYSGQQLAAHMQMLDTLEVFKNFASGDLRRVIEEGIGTTQNHLKHARQLVQDLDKSSTETARSGQGQSRQ